MTVLNIEGKQVNVDDSFMKLSPEDQDATVQDIAKSLGSGSSTAPDQDLSVSAAARGLPIAGAFTDKAQAAINAAAQPLFGSDLSNAPTFRQRMAEAEPKITQRTNAYEEAHPIRSAVEKTAIGSLPFVAGGMAAAPAKLLGMSGTLPEMVGYGAGSGGVIGGADAAARGENPLVGAGEGVVSGAALPLAGRAIGAVGRGVRNLVAPTPRVPYATDLAGVRIPVRESYVTRDNLAGSREQQALAGTLGQEPQRVAQQATQATTDATKQAAEQFGGTLNPTAPPGAPQVGPHEAASQTITELAQQHNDQITAQARHDAQVAAEGAGIRGNVGAPLSAAEPAPPTTAGNAVQAIQDRMQAQQGAAAQNRTNLYTAAAQIPGEFHPASFNQVGNSIRTRINQAVPPGGRPVTINPQLTPHASAMLEMLDNRLGNNYYQNALRRGDMIQMPDGRVVPRPLTPADVESARQEMVGHLRDANNAARVPGGSGTDAFAAQRVMDAFDGHLNSVLATPGAFSGDGQAYRQAILQARAAHAQYRGTYSNQGNGDTVGPVIERMLGRQPGQEMQPGQMATALFGPQNNPGGGNSLPILQRARQIVGQQSPEWQQARQGMLSHILDTPEGMDALPPAKQADRLQTYLTTPHAAELFTQGERTRLMAHATDLRAQAQAAPRQTALGKTLGNLAGAETGIPATSGELVKQIFPKTGEVQPGADKLLDALHAQVSEPTWNGIRQAMWKHLLERPEGVTEYGPKALSQRLARFLDTPIAKSMYTSEEQGVMKQFATHYAKLEPLPNTTNPSGSATMAAKLVRGAGSYIFRALGFTLGGGGITGHLAGAMTGAAMDKAIAGLKDVKLMNQTKDVYLGKSPSHQLNRNYERAGAIIGHAARSLGAG